jgi:hypothetical protein
VVQRSQFMSTRPRTIELSGKSAPRRRDDRLKSSMVSCGPIGYWLKNHAFYRQFTSPFRRLRLLRKPGFTIAHPTSASPRRPGRMGRHVREITTGMAPTVIPMRRNRNSRLERDNTVAERLRMTYSETVISFNCKKSDYRSDCSYVRC